MLCFLESISLDSLFNKASPLQVHHIYLYHSLSGYYLSNYEHFSGFHVEIYHQTSTRLITNPHLHISIPFPSLRSIDTSLTLIWPIILSSSYNKVHKFESSHFSFVHPFGCSLFPYCHFWYCIPFQFLYIIVSIQDQLISFLIYLRPQNSIFQSYSGSTTEFLILGLQNPTLWNLNPLSIIAFFPIITKSYLSYLLYIFSLVCLPSNFNYVWSYSYWFLNLYLGSLIYELFISHKKIQYHILYLCRDTDITEINLEFKFGQIWTKIF